MSNLLQEKLPKYVVDVIKLYTGEGEWRNGRYVNIKKIPKNDCRYDVLKKRPRIKQIHHTSSLPTKAGCVWFKVNGKFMVLSVCDQTIWSGNGMNRISGYFWEMHYNEDNTRVYLG
jgi:hypothetical protein